MIEFVRPEAYLLVIPVVLLLRRRFAERPLVGVLRALLLLALLTALAEPHYSTGESGRDLVLVVDRSRSVGAAAEERAGELFEGAVEGARVGDRIAVVAFGRDSVVETSPTEAVGALSMTAGTRREVDRDATDLATALDRALALIPPNRNGSVLLVSDGESTGGRPLAAARAALRRGVRLDAVPVERPGVTDLAVEEIALPGEVAVGEPFRFSAWIRSERAGEVPFRLVRDGQVIAEGRHSLRPGVNRIVFEDRLVDAGVHRYDVEIADNDDRVPENDRASAVVRAMGGDRVLLVSPEGGRPGRLLDALQKAGIDVMVTGAASAPLDLDRLDGFRCVVLENVPADDLPVGAMDVLRAWVSDFGGGLLMTGGQASFGIGGYHRSPVEEVLPVTMEVRQEQRRFGLAMAIALDRSGSMMAPAGGGKTKMDLANAGTIAAVELLGPADACSVIAVDSSAHVVVPMSDVLDREPIIRRVAQIESGGGGIFVFEALEAMADELAETDHSTKHMVLFADANDSEEPGDYRGLIPKLRSAGITLSVIGLGQPTDSDASLLLDLARLGGGRCKFVSEVKDLPRVFAQETLQVARSSFARDPVAVDVLPDLLGVGDPLGGKAFPELGGYSLGYLQSGASVGLRSADDVGAPVFSFWQRGLGRSAAFLGEVDGEHTGRLGSWDGFTDFFATVVRWLGGSHANEDVWADLRREGHEAVLTVELAEGREGLLAGLQALVRAPDGVVDTLHLERLDERRLEARFPLSEAGAFRAAVQVGADRAVVVAPVTLPYSPEFEPRTDPGEGPKLLAELAELTGGRIDPPLAELFEGPRDSVGFRAVGEWFLWLALALLLLEIVVRRLDLRLPAVPLPKLARRAPAKAAVGQAPSAEERRSSGPIGSAPPPAAAPKQPAASASAPAPAGSDDDSGLGSVLDRARRRAARRR